MPAQVAVVSQTGSTLSFFDLTSRRRTSLQPVVAQPHDSSAARNQGAHGLAYISAG